MTALLFLKCVGCGLIGILLHLSFELPNLKQQSIAANVPLTIRQILKMEWINIAKSVIAVIAFAIGFDEIAKFKPLVMEIVKWFFMFIGVSGSFILFALFGKAKKQILEVIDKKTDIADGK